MRKYVLFAVIAFVLVFFPIETLFAATCINKTSGATRTVSTCSECDTSTESCTSSGGTGCGGDNVCLENPLGDKATDPNILIGTIINGILGVVGSLALVMFIIGGMLWMTSAGNAERVTKGKNTIIYATLGLIIIFSAYAMVKFVLEAIGG